MTRVSFSQVLILSLLISIGLMYTDLYLSVLPEMSE